MPTAPSFSMWKESDLMRKILSLVVAAILVAGAAGHVAADLISEFEPNPAGTDPNPTPVELSGTPGAAFSGFLTFIDTDGGTALGGINSSDAVNGTFDMNGLAVVNLPFDAENPSYTIVFSSAQPTADVDEDDDRVLDDASVFGTVFDAVGIIDATGDATDFATALGGVEFSTANEFELAFRDASTGQFFGVDTGTGDVFDTSGTIFGAADFDLDPLASTFGSINPTFAVPEPSSGLVLGLFAGLGLIRRKR